MDILKYKNKIMAGILLVLLIIFIISAVNFYNSSTLEQTRDTYTHEAGKELVLNASDFFDTDEKKAAQITFDTSAVDKDTAGEYTMTAEFKNKSFEIKVTVVDTTAPMVEFSNRYVFTNDIENTDFNSMLAGVYDASEWTVEMVRFEHRENLSELDEVALKRLMDEIPLPCNAEELQTVGTADIPAEEGIYRAVLEIADVHGNSTLEEVYVVYDTTGARIDDTADKTVYAEKDNMDKEPEVNKADYSITDNVDGKISPENINCELELRDAEKHEWLVHVSYTDRAGNESRAEFLIIVKEGESENESEPDNDTGSNKDGADNAGNDGTAGTAGTRPDTGNDDNKTASTTPDKGNSDAGNTNTTPDAGNGNGGRVTDNGNTDNSGEKYDPADSDKDGVVTDDENANYISPSEQKLLDAGVGVVVKFDTGNYGVLTHSDGYVNGVYGTDILRNYLASIKLTSSNMGSGGYLGANDEYRWYVARDVYELITPDDEEFWD